MQLIVNDLTVLYDRAMVLNKINLKVDYGEMVSLVGPNGAGKTTALRAIAGLIMWEKTSLKGTVGGKINMQGEITFEKNRIDNIKAHEIVKKGLFLCPERGRPFREMTIKENLLAGAYLCKDKKTIQENLDKVYDLFPILRERENQIAGTISGGQRTMLAIGRSLMAQARMLLIDEPSVGLAPKVKEDLFERVKNVHKMGITILLTEQDIGFAFNLATRNYVLSQGHIITEGTAKELLANDSIRKSYLGM